jgi:cysteinyl-tRNA synthetase
MSKKHLGDTIDLHTGGVDLLFPHHENEIAQSQCCNGTTFANHWYHSEHLLVDGKKMSKSLGNLYTLDDLKAKGFSPMALRYALLSGHPRKQLNFTLDSLHAAESALKKLRGFASHVMLQAGVTASVFNSQEFISGGDNESETAFTAVIDCLKDDLNSPSALGSLFSAIDITGHDLGSLAKEHCRQFARVVFALGLDLTEVAAPKADIPADIAALAEKRWATKQAKDFAAADALRKELTSAGWSMLDRKDGYSLEPVKK